MSGRRSIEAALGAVAALVVVGCQPSEHQLAGTVERRIFELAAPVSEVVVEIPVRLGESVVEGQELVRLDTKVAEAELRASEAARDAAQAALVAAEREFGRFEGLRRSRVATEQQSDEARRGRDEAAAMLAEREARIAQAQKRLTDLSVVATASGFVDQLPFEVGERVPPGAVLAVVLADDRPWVRVWLPARSTPRVSPGDRAAVRVEGMEEVLQGRVLQISRQPAYTPHYALTEKESAHLVYETRVEIEDAPAELRPGLSAWVELLPNNGGD